MNLLQQAFLLSAFHCIVLRVVVGVVRNWQTVGLAVCRRDRVSTKYLVDSLSDRCYVKTLGTFLTPCVPWSTQPPILRGTVLSISFWDR